MSNPYYTYSGDFIPFSSARAEAVASEFQAVQAGFALLAATGVDSGSATAYVITTQGAPTVTYVDGGGFNFKAANTNTGPATINVNGIGAVSLLRYSGAALSAGDINVDVWYEVIYNSTYGGYTVVSPIPQVTVSGAIASTAPSSLVGLVAAAGSSTSVCPIDAAFAIDQTIAPTWTGTHTFEGSGAEGVGTLFFQGGSNSSDSIYHVQWGGGNISVVNTGTNTCSVILSASGYVSMTNAYGSVKLFADGGVTIGSPTGGDKGAGTLNIAGTLYVNGTAVTVP